MKIQNQQEKKIKNQFKFTKEFCDEIFNDKINLQKNEIENCKNENLKNKNCENKNIVGNDFEMAETLDDFYELDEADILEDSSPQENDSDDEDEE